MPFCTQCGHQASGHDAFCANCGTPQPGSGSSARPSVPYSAQSPGHDALSGLTPHTAAILCYVPAIGWIAAIIVLAARKFKNDHIVRFHAFQGLYLFAAWLVVDWVIRPLTLAVPDHFVRIDQILKAAILAVSIFMMVKASHDEPYVLPIIGELAQRSATEQ
jgi:uncharacterized membrane protein